MNHTQVNKKHPVGLATLITFYRFKTISRNLQSLRIHTHVQKLHNCHNVQIHFRTHPEHKITNDMNGQATVFAVHITNIRIQIRKQGFLSTTIKYLSEYITL